MNQKNEISVDKLKVLILANVLDCFSDSHQITPVLHLLTITIRNWRYQNIEKPSFLSAPVSTSSFFSGPVSASSFLSGPVSASSFFSAPVGSSTSSFASMAPDLRIPSRDQQSGIVFSVLEKPI